LAVGVVSETADLGDGGRVHAFAGAGHGDGAEVAEDCVGVEGFEVGAAAGAGLRMRTRWPRASFSNFFHLP
jgi:hypothetical protein